MNILDRVRSAFGGGAERRYHGPGQSSALYSQVSSGVVVTPETALTLASAFAAINVLSTDVGMLGFHVYRKAPGGGSEIARDHPVNELLSLAPNPETDAMRLRQATMGHALGWGNGYLEIERNTYTGEPRAIHALSPRWSDTRPFRLPSGRLRYSIDGGRRTLPPSDVIHVAGLGWDGLVGYSPVAMCRQAIGLALAAEKFGASFYGNGSTPKGLLTVAKKLSTEAFRRLRDSFDRVHQGPDNAHKIAILEEGMGWTQTSINPDDAQFLGTRAFQVVEVARIYRTPPHKIGDYSQAHLANLEESNLDYLQTALMPWLIAWEQQANRKLLTTAERLAGLYCRHDLSVLLRGNSQARAAYYDVMERIGVMSPNQIAGLEDLPPVPNGDVHFAPANMLTLDSINRAAAASVKVGADPNLPQLPNLITAPAA